MDQKLVAKIEALGIAEKKAKVYIALLELGNATADEIAKTSNLNRSTTYVQIDSLMSDGLISKYKDGKKTKFNAESPLNIDRLLKTQEEAFKEREAKATALIPELIDLYSSAGDRATVRYFDGIEGLRALRDELLKVKSKEYYAAASVDTMRELFSQQELAEFSEKRSKKGIKVRLMYTLDKKEEGWAVGEQQILRVDPEKYPFSSDVYIYDDNVSFAVSGERVGGVIIQSKSIADTMRSIYELAWRSLKDS